MASAVANLYSRCNSVARKADKILHIAGGNNELVLLGGGGYQHIGGAAGNALRLQLAAQCASALPITRGFTA
jgi:hypothetical protein